MSSSQALQRAKQIYDNRRRRDRELNHLNVFGEPGWDILLMLFIADEEGATVPLTEACAALDVPASVTTRWFTALETKGLVQHKFNENEARILTLSPTAREMLKSYFLGASLEDALTEGQTRAPFIVSKSSS